VDTATEVFAGPIGMTFAVVWGAIWGSFFNVVIARLPHGKSIIRPGSHCFACGAAVRAFDNVPVLSYVWLRGRCRSCGGRFSIRYPLVEALTAALAAAIWWAFVSTAAATTDIGLRLGRFSLYFAFTGLLLVLSVIDLDTRRLPDSLTIPGTAILFAAGFAVHDVPWAQRAIGVAAGYLFVRLVADFYYHVLKREGLGLGDGKLLAMIGAVEGWKALPVVVFLASLLGTVISIPLLLLVRRRSRRAGPAAVDDAPSGALRNVQIPFGPFIALAAVTFLFAGDRILAWVLPTE
jgi:leader peptidase (prepilin peptidase) / N-methyltransferase